MCSALQRGGHDVTLYAPRFRAGNGQLDIAEYYGLAERFAFRPRLLPAVRGGSHIFAAGAARVARATADLTYTRTIEGAFYATLFGAPTIFEAHAPVEVFRPHRRWMLSRVIRSRHTRRIVVISNYLRDRYLEMGATSVVVAADAADLPRATGVASVSPGGGPLRIGFAGSLYRGRGVDLLLALARRCPWAVFEVYGGPLTSANGTRIELQQPPNLRFHGRVDPARVPELLAGCDVLVAPYERAVFTATNRMDTSRWMSPLKIFEYMAVRRPILCSDLPAIREILDDGVTALLCAPDELDAWVRALVALRDAPDLRARLADAAFARLQRDYTWTVRVERIMEGLREL
jgi:glycosyltransferase involved in cell wall biosynthesis